MKSKYKKNNDVFDSSGNQVRHNYRSEILDNSSLYPGDIEKTPTMVKVFNKDRKRKSGTAFPTQASVSSMLDVWARQPVDKIIPSSEYTQYSVEELENEYYRDYETETNSPEDCYTSTHESSGSIEETIGRKDQYYDIVYSILGLSESHSPEERECDPESTPEPKPEPQLTKDGITAVEQRKITKIYRNLETSEILTETMESVISDPKGDPLDSRATETIPEEEPSGGDEHRTNKPNALPNHTLIPPVDRDFEIAESAVRKFIGINGIKGGVEIVPSSIEPDQIDRSRQSHTPLSVLLNSLNENKLQSIEPGEYLKLHVHSEENMEKFIQKLYENPQLFIERVLPDAWEFTKQHENIQVLSSHLTPIFMSDNIVNTLDEWKTLILKYVVDTVESSDITLNVSHVTKVPHETQTATQNKSRKSNSSATNNKKQASPSVLSHFHGMVFLVCNDTFLYVILEHIKQSSTVTTGSRGRNQKKAEKPLASQPRYKLRCIFYAFSKEYMANVILKRTEK